MSKIVAKLFDLSGKVIVLGGGAGQIGFSMAEALVDAGSKIAIVDTDIDLAKSKLSTFHDEKIVSNVSLYKADVSSRDEVLAVWESIARDYDSIYGLINCFHFKGDSRRLDTSSNFFVDFEKYPEEAWDKVHDVNLKGTFLMCQAAIPYFKKTNLGIIVNVSSTYGNVSPNKSIYGDSGINSPVAYASSKAAIINLTRYIATHMAEHGIRANILSPGGVFNDQKESFIKKYNQLTPLRRMATAEDYQGAILFLMSNASSYMTGANLIVDGGWTAW